MKPAPTNVPPPRTVLDRRVADRVTENESLPVGRSMETVLGHSAVPATRIAVCGTGLERSYPEIRGNVLAGIFGMLSRAAPNVETRFFGVRPLNDTWPHALVDLGAIVDTVEIQHWCRPQDEVLPWWFTCTRGRKTTRGGECTRSFVQMMCDL